MVQGFNAELKCQQEWGWLLSVWLFLSGTGCGLNPCTMFFSRLRLTS